LEYVAAGDVPLYFALADCVLLPYRHHVGSSGVLTRAAAAGKPALVSDYGTLGALTRRYGLGLARDLGSAEAIAAGWTQMMSAQIESTVDREGMREFAARNSVEKFCETIFRISQQ
jgi:glycosyltransferase involved in cell wall biosynthesis